MRQYTNPRPADFGARLKYGPPAELTPSDGFHALLWWYTLDMLQLQDIWPLVPWPQFVAQ